MFTIKTTIRADVNARIRNEWSHVMVSRSREIWLGKLKLGVRLCQHRQITVVTGAPIPLEQVFCRS